MNRDDFEGLVDSTVDHLKAMREAKGAEYANSDDRLANFKRGAERNGHTVLEEWMTYWNKHIDSIHSYVARVRAEAIKRALRQTIMEACNSSLDGEALPDSIIGEAAFRAKVNSHLWGAKAHVDSQLSEPIEGRFHDNINYSFLALGILKELSE